MLEETRRPGRVLAEAPLAAPTLCPHTRHPDSRVLMAQYQVGGVVAQHNWTCTHPLSLNLRQWSFHNWRSRSLTHSLTMAQDQLTAGHAIEVH